MPIDAVITAEFARAIRASEQGGVGAGISFDRFDRTDENRFGVARSPGDGVQAKMHPINEINVSVPAFEKHRLGSRRPSPAERVRGPIVDAEVSFGFDDTRPTNSDGGSYAEHLS